MADPVQQVVERFKRARPKTRFCGQGFPVPYVSSASLRIRCRSSGADCVLRPGNYKD
jgi:hypothetical protein